MAQMLGGEFIAAMLKNEGVECVFGIIDGTYFGLYSSLRNYDIKLVSPRHETCALHMAGAYARMTGKLGVCIASNGPGVANALPGVAVENGEGNRVLLITSCRRVGIGYPDRGGTYQYFNQTGVTKAMTKWSGHAIAHDRIAEMMKRAFRTSWKGRPGVVHVDVAEDLINSKMNVDDMPNPARYRRQDPIEPSPAHVEAAAQMLVEARAPHIHAGSGIIHSHGTEALRRVAELLHAPVATSWAGRSALPDNHPLAMPMMHVGVIEEMRNESDVVLTLGSRIGETDRWGKAPHWRQAAEQRMIQVDLDEDFLGLNKPADIAVLGDARVFLERLAVKLEGMTGQMDKPHREEWVRGLKNAAAKNRADLDKHLQPKGSPMCTAHIPHICDKVLPENSIAVIDGGNAAVWGHFFHEVRTANSVLQTAKFGMLGAGVSQALGACVAHPDRQVFCIIGDGAMGFHMQEIETAVRNKLKPIYLVCCDKQWGMVKMNQQFALRPIKTMITKSLGPNETINADFSETRFDLVAESMGAHGERVSDAADLDIAIRRCIEADVCSVIHCDVDPVKHMWAPNLLEFKKMHDEPKGK